LDHFSHDHVMVTKREMMKPWLDSLENQELYLRT
jgi:hypothetical protein